MNKCKSLLPIVLLFIACQPRQERDEGSSIPYYGAIEIHHVPLDSISKPEVRRLESSDIKIVPAGKPIVHPLRKFDNLAGQFQPLIVDDPMVFTPGQDTFPLPKMVEAIEKSIVAGTPKVVRVKDPSSKDDNPFGFLSYAKKQGLNNSRIQDFIEDKHGNLWLGTYGGGISKYDGKNITSFSTQQGLLTDYIWPIFEDSKGNLWIGSAIGLIRYDGNFFITFETNDSVLGEMVWGITEDQSGNLWLGSSGGLIKYDGKTFAIYTKFQGLNLNGVRKILTDIHGNIWMSTGSNLIKFDGLSFYQYNFNKEFTNNIFFNISEDREGNMWFGSRYGAVKFDGSEFTNITTNEGLHSNVISYIYQDENRNMWFGSFGAGLAKYDGKKFIHYSTAFGFPHEDVHKILEDKTGNLWLATHAGIVKYTGNAFTHYSSGDGLDVHNYIQSMTTDDAGNIWLSTDRKGAWKYDGSSFSEFTKNEGLRMNGVPGVLKDNKGNLWFGDVSCNISKYDGPTFTHFPVIPNSGHCHINSMLEDKSGNIWFSTFFGALKFDGESFTHFTDKNGLSTNAVYNILEDHSGNIWFATDKGITVYDGDGFKHFNKQDTTKYDFINVLAEDQFRNIWIGTPNDGVYRYDGSSFMHFTTRDGLAANDISCILVDKSGNIWFGTTNGLSMLDRGKVLKLNELGSKISAGETSFKSDDKIDALFKNYIFDDGFLGIGVNFGAPTMLEDREGSIWVAANDRLTVIHPEGLSYNSVPPNIQINSIELFNEQIAWGKILNQQDSVLTLGNGVKVKSYKFDDLSSWYGLPVNLSLASNNNFLTFNFIGITMHQPDRVMYQYKLEGIDENWSSLTSKSSANYGNLPDGKFTFLVKAMNSDGVWSDTIKYEFEIRPPWWRTWWAYLIYTLLLLLALRIFSRWRERNLRTEKENLERIVEERTEELVQSLENLKSAQAQLVQQEKLASLGQLTAGIAHEIKNPLNFVNNFSEVNLELVEEIRAEIVLVKTQDIASQDIASQDLASQDLASQDPASQRDVNKTLETVNNILDDIQSNLSKIHQHGTRADGIVRSMLMHSRGGAGKMEPVDLNALIREYVNLAFHGMRAGRNPINVTIDLQLDKNIGTVELIAEDFSRVILNLCNNAFDAMCDKYALDESYQPLLTVRTSRQPDGVCIDVQDNGPGIPDDVKDKVLEPFFTTKKGTQGTGLGLSITHDIVKAHGGKISINTQENEGTVFTIELPI